MEENEKYLADWLAGSITDEQLRKLVSPDDFKSYLILRDSLADYQLADPSMDENYRMIRRKIDQPKAKKVKVRPLFYYISAAAMIAIIFGLSQIFWLSNSDESLHGERLSVKLSDNSRVELNHYSSVSYSPLFKYNRTIELSGESFFDVANGSTFTVCTDQGTVTVLGTKFNVIDRKDYFEVTCFEGVVKVKTDLSEITLSKGQGYRMFDGNPERFNIISTVPGWLQSEASFHGSPYYFVIDELERLFAKHVTYPEKLRAVRFTGGVSNKDIEKALMSVCKPLNLTYTIEGDHIIISE